MTATLLACTFAATVSVLYLVTVIAATVRPLPAAQQQPARVDDTTAILTALSALTAAQATPGKEPRP